MLSIIVYGRHDQHGYHYSKRFAISLNCMAEMLNHDDDEILFVDYNTPDDTPTIVEALKDTLTDKAKSLLRTLRVRPHHHPSHRTTLPVCEPLARNVALRRSNPKNKWILSTNIDMIFVLENPKLSLSDIVTDLPDGFYQLPRFEIPENLWELQFDRLNPQANIEFLRENAENFHLKTIVRRPGFLMFDNPGDFQLMLREDIFRIGGFDEDMVLGWHVDSNIAKRFSLLYPNQSLENKIYGYHCNHNKKMTLFHEKHRTENDWNHFVSHVKTPFLTKQPENWGLRDEEIEEISLSENKSHPIAVKNCLKTFDKKPSELLIDLNSFNLLTYSTPSVFSYLTDHLCTLPKENYPIAYFGYNKRLLNLLKNYFQESGLKGEISHNEMPDSSSKNSLCIFDFGFDESYEKSYKEARKELKKIMTLFLKHKNRNAKIIGINVLNTDFRFLFQKYLASINSSYVTGISYGYLKPKSRKRNRHNRKKKLIFNSLYLLTRYFYSHTDKVRKAFSKSKPLSKMKNL